MTSKAPGALRSSCVAVASMTADGPTIPTGTSCGLRRMVGGDVGGDEGEDEGSTAASPIKSLPLSPRRPPRPGAAGSGGSGGLHHLRAILHTDAPAGRNFRMTAQPEERTMVSERIAAGTLPRSAGPAGRASA